MSGLPSMVNVSKITRSLQTEFGSYNHTDSAMNGDIYDMKNLSSDKFPLLSVRKKRTTVKTPGKQIIGFLGSGELFVLYERNDDGKNPFTYGEKDGTVSLESNEEKTVCSFGSYIIIMPDKVYINTEDLSSGYLEATVTLTATFKNGTLYGEDAAANTIYCDNAGFDTIFKEGDALEISGCTEYSDNNKTVIVREISQDSLIFYENTFTLPEGDSKYTENSQITISRKVPELDFMCENENRLWGCKGSTVYASKPGDIFNFNVFDDLSTDSFAVSVGSPGDFTGCISYKGFPCFFKEDYIYKVYGDKASNFQLMCTASAGVASGCGKSLEIAGETLFYMSRNGICAYTGGMPVNISHCFGDIKYSNAVGGSDGIKYYVSVKDEAEKSSLFVYDTRFGVWHKEDDSEAHLFARHNGILYMLLSDDSIYGVNGGDGDTKDDISWECEFASLYEHSSYNKRSTPIPTKKGIVRFYIRAELSEGASMNAYIQFDGEDTWQEIGYVSAQKKKSVTLPIIPRRAEHYKLRLSGKGDFTIYSITREYYVGSFI